MNLRSATFIYAFGKYSKVLIQLLVTVILARLLTPYDYGIVAIITVFSSLFSAISDMGFGVAIVQKRWLKESQINDIYVFTFYFSIVISILFGCSSFLIAFFYKDEVYIYLGWLLSLSLFFNALNMVPNGLMNKKQLFLKISIRTIVAYLSSAIIAVILAMIGFKYYSLVCQSIAASAITYFWNVFNTNLHLKLRFKMESIKAIFSYSSYQFAFNVINYISENLDNLLTGKFLGSKELGFYSKAFNLSLYPVDNLVGVITPVLHPILAEYQKNKEVIYKKYLKVYRILSILGIWLSIYCFFASREIILIFYGNQWKNAILPFHILSIVMFTRILNSSCGAIFQVLNNTKLLFYNGTLNTILTVLAIIIGIFGGRTINSLAACVAISYFVQYLTAFFMLIKMAFNYRIIMFLKDIYKYLIIFIITFLSIYFYNINISSLFLSAIVKLIYISIIMFICLYILGETKILKAVVQR